MSWSFASRNSGRSQSMSRTNPVPKPYSDVSPTLNMPTLSLVCDTRCSIVSRLVVSRARQIGLPGTSALKLYRSYQLGDVGNPLLLGIPSDAFDHFHRRAGVDE